jgi:hypothetical protein
MPAGWPATSRTRLPLRRCTKPEPWLFCSLRSSEQQIEGRGSAGCWTTVVGVRVHGLASEGGRDAVSRAVQARASLQSHAAARKRSRRIGDEEIVEGSVLYSLRAKQPS